MFKRALVALALLVAPCAHAQIMMTGVGPAGDTAPAVYLPTVACSPSGVWATRQLVSAYGGALYQALKASDSSTLQISPIGGGTLAGQEGNTSGYTAFVGASTATINDIYDQSGNGFDAIQASAALNPAFRLLNQTRGNQAITFGFNAANGTTRTSQLNISSSLSIARQSASLFIVTSSLMNSNTNQYGGLGNSSTNQLFLYSDTNTNTNASFDLNAFGNALYKVPVLQATANPSVMAVTSSASNVVAYANAASQTRGSAFTATTLTGGTIGRDTIFNFNSAQDFFAMIAYPCALSSSDVAAVNAALYTNYSIVATPLRKINPIPNSYEATWVTNDWNRSAWRQVDELTTFRWQINPTGITGRTLATALTNATQWTSKYDATKTLSVLFVDTAYNDVNALASGAIVGGETAIYNTIKSIVSTWNALGANAKSIVSTGIIPLSTTFSGSGTDQSQKITVMQNLNTLILAGTANGYTVADVAALNLNMASTTISPDGVHPTETGDNGTNRGGVIAGAMNALN